MSTKEIQVQAKRLNKASRHLKLFGISKSLKNDTASGNNSRTDLSNVCAEELLMHNVSESTRGRQNLLYLQNLSPHKNAKSHIKEKNKIRIFYNWKIQLHNGNLVILGNVEGEKDLARSKSISTRLTSKKLLSLNHHTYILDGDLHDVKHELPKYVQKEFLKGFPENWIQIFEKWKLFVAKGAPSDFNWQSFTSNSIGKPIKKNSIVSESIAKYHGAETSDRLDTVFNSSKNQKSRSFDSNVLITAEDAHNLLNFVEMDKLLKMIDKVRDPNCTQEFKYHFTNLMNILDYINKSNLNEKNNGSKISATHSNFENTVKIENTIKTNFKEIKQTRKSSDSYGTPKMPAVILKKPKSPPDILSSTHKMLSKVSNSNKMNTDEKNNSNSRSRELEKIDQKMDQTCDSTDFYGVPKIPERILEKIKSSLKKTSTRDKKNPRQDEKVLNKCGNSRVAALINGSWNNAMNSLHSDISIVKDDEENALSNTFDSSARAIGTSIKQRDQFAKRRSAHPYLNCRDYTTLESEKLPTTKHLSSHNSESQEIKTIDNIILNFWSPFIVKIEDHSYGLTFKGCRIDEAGNTLKAGFTTGLISRRHSSHFLESDKGELITLKGHCAIEPKDGNDKSIVEYTCLIDNNCCPKIVTSDELFYFILQECQTGCPLYIDLFCNKWLQLELSAKQETKPQRSYELKTTSNKCLKSDRIKKKVLQKRKINKKLESSFSSQDEDIHSPEKKFRIPRGNFLKLRPESD